MELTTDRTTTYVSKVVFSLLANDAWIATKYVSEKLTIKATRVLYKGPKARKRILKDNNINIVISVGRPNFDEKEFIKKCKKVRESFPIKNIQLKFPPKSKKKK